MYLNIYIYIYIYIQVGADVIGQAIILHNYYFPITFTSRNISMAVCTLWTNLSVHNSL